MHDRKEFEVQTTILLLHIFEWQANFLPPFFHPQLNAIILKLCGHFLFQRYFFFCVKTIRVLTIFFLKSSLYNDCHVIIYLQVQGFYTLLYTTISDQWRHRHGMVLCFKHLLSMVGGLTLALSLIWTEGLF